MLSDDVGEEPDELCALWIHARVVLRGDLRLGLRRVEHRGLHRPQPHDDATAKDGDEAVCVTTGAEHEGTEPLVAYRQRFACRGRELGADEVVVPAAFPRRLNARSMLRG